MNRTDPGVIWRGKYIMGPRPPLHLQIYFLVPNLALMNEGVGTKAQTFRV